MSYAGISVSADAVANCHEVAAHKVSFVFLKLNDANTQVVVDVAGPAAGASFEDTLAALTAQLPANEPRFAVASGPEQKLVYIRWIPESTSARAKMLYAGCSNTLKIKLPGPVVEVQAETKEELSYHAVSQWGDAAISYRGVADVLQRHHRCEYDAAGHGRWGQDHVLSIIVHGSVARARAGIRPLQHMQLDLDLSCTGYMLQCQGPSGLGCISE
eukprot:CAMPEP_0202900778 /NCGR_PEP_ID=MMETSP1392-20130828/12031_1 /ASSEMBLY_ACC=CAM_ASM_000868 /TAXON_ID=225041 /ORGANISM="Chlamydomonas chlamydogama, Strain SAG 11-48b" /LENGTH=214 /DNA_ID=CAMNT_0049587221 /DNA_START=149 /DNA_END=795 /DNA_ORIENTATION=-